MPVASIAGAGAGGAVVGAALLATMFWLLGFNERSWLFLYLIPAAAGLVFGHLYIRIACRVAPVSKFGTGAVMVTLLGLYCLLTIFLAVTVPTVGVQLPSAALSAFLAATLTLVSGWRSGLGPNNSFKPNPLRGSA